MATSRRTFIKQSIAGITFFQLNPLQTFSIGHESIRLTLLHTNDMHSRIEPFPNDGRKYANLGGMARRAHLIEEIRKKEKNVLLLDAGDIFQGTPYFNFFGGALEFKLMSKMKYDAATLGNHDFDNGIAGLEKMLPHAQFPFLSANYDFSANSLKNRFLPYKLFEFEKKVKVGVFGIGIELEGLVPGHLYDQTKYLDPVGTAREMVQELKSKKCDLIICLSHLGYSYESEKIDDQKLALQVPGIDLIIGGHTHTFLDKPTIIKNNFGNETLINQVGWAGIKLGRIDFELIKKGQRKVLSQESISIR